MEKLKKIARKALPHAVALVLFALVSMLFFAPQYSGKALRQSDMVHYSGMARDAQQMQEESGVDPQWTGRMFGGMPTSLINMQYEGRVVKQAAEVAYFLGQPAALIFIAMAGFYLMLLLFGVNPWLAMAGGLGYGLSTFFIIIIGVGHVTQMMALGWAPPMVGAVFYAYRKRIWLGAALAGLFASVEISCSHPQITYYFLFVLVALVINEFVVAFKDKKLGRFGKATAALVLAAALAVGSNLVQLYNIADYGKDSIRSASELTTGHTSEQTSGLDKDYATAWSYGKMESLDMFIPYLFGGGHNFSPGGQVDLTFKDMARQGYQVPRDAYAYYASYWGPQDFTEGPVYVGAVLVFLAVLALFLLKGREKWWIAAVSLLALLLAWGHHMMWLSSWFLDYFPMYNKFRTVSMILVIIEWSVPLLAVLGLQKLWEGGVDKKKFKNALLWALGLTGGVAVLVLLFGGVFGGFENGYETRFPEELRAAMAGERASMMRLDALRSLGWVVVAAGLVWLFYNGKLKKGLFVAGVTTAIFLDLFFVDRRFVSERDFQPKRTASVVPMTEADQLILQDTTNYRVANFAVPTFMDASTSYYHRSVGGYHGAKMRRYQELITRHMNPKEPWMDKNVAVYSMLNAKYFILPNSESENGQPEVHLNPDAPGNAWFVRELLVVPGPDEEIAALDQGIFNPRRMAVVDKRYAREIASFVPANDTTSFVHLPFDSTSTASLTGYQPNHLRYTTRSDSAGLVVFSEIYYPKGWTATLDGQPAPHFGVDYVLRAMVVPAGEHTIEFHYAAPHFATLVGITRTCSWILLIGALVLIAGATVCPAGCCTCCCRKKSAATGEKPSINEQNAVE